MDKNHKKLNKFADPNSGYFWGNFWEKFLGEIGVGGVKFVATLGC